MVPEQRQAQPMFQPLMLPTPDEPPAPRERSRTAREALDDMYVAVGGAATLDAVTTMGMKSLAAVERKRLEIIAEYPDVNILLQGLMVNHAMQLVEMQRSVTNDVKKVL